MQNYAVQTWFLSKNYGRQKVVYDINISIPTGKIYALLGRNGAGKTTIIRMIMGLTNPTSGEISIFGHKINRNSNNIYNRIGCMIETPGFYQSLTAYENLELIARMRGIHDKNTIFNALELVNLQSETKKVFGNYSLGMKQRLGIAAAIMHNPKLLILDEPTNGLDPIGVVEIRKFLKNICSEKNMTLLISSHILSEIEQIADIIGVVSEGSLLELSIDEIKKQNTQHQSFTLKTVKQQQIDVIKRILTDNGIEIADICANEMTLEDFFLEQTGGVGIG